MTGINLYIDWTTERGQHRSETFSEPFEQAAIWHAEALVREAHYHHDWCHGEIHVNGERFAYFGSEVSAPRGVVVTP